MGAQLVRPAVFLNGVWLSALLVLCLIALVSVLNTLTFPRLGRMKGRQAAEKGTDLQRLDGKGSAPLVSILVPARDEAHNLPRTLDGLLQQQYPNFELLVLDDNSSDGTFELIQQRAQSDPRLRALKGTSLPPGWIGKNWACQQLAEHSQGEFLVFTDADVDWQPQALSNLIDLMAPPHETDSSVDCLTVWPTQRTLGLPERLVVPLMMFSIIAYLPELAVRKIPWPIFSAANGQCLAFRRAAYEQIGGHWAVRQRVIEDVGLAWQIKRSGHRLVMALGNQLISGRMYHNWAEVRAGFAKNILAGHGGSPAFLLLSTVFHWGLFIVPWFWLAAALFLGDGNSDLAIPLAMVALGVGVRALSAAASGHRVLDALLMPVSVGMMTIIGGLSIWWHYHDGGPQWKGRRIPDRPKLVDFSSKTSFGRMRK